MRRGNHLELTERKKTILNAIVRNYLETGEPVGSRTISKYTDLNLSSATIRNEMADLEEMGLILQPHTSAGRIPSDQGYRIYVDDMLAQKEKEVDSMREMLLDKEEKLENLLKHVARQLADNTNYATMVSTPTMSKNKLKFLQISRVDADHLLATIVLEGNLIKNKMIPVEEELDDATILKLNMILNTNLSGISVENINLGLIAALKAQAGIHSEIVGHVIDAAAESIRADEELEIYTSGTNNILKYPELSDNKKASELINTFEEKSDLTSLVESSLSATEHGIQVYIGNETPVDTMKDCSVVTATYELAEGMRGTVGIIGPKRMDYDKVVSTLKKMMHQLDDLYKKND
ncbi:heat-inducible transcriptional repressor HrcA [Butyrivibrio fibrisolvens]|jgi:heat-inducible transcriptional repressor|uniref:heat-inducible transcriptional repressor HrcA n=1 Tax=Butyrivibrio fibrisolvens TaxID=831 RepID=UPI000487DD21|nr:heat-inducible transcription repressor HrcA [Butyrivibrio sp.]MCR4635309.1 heat-inducible transcriptional repressor HrcA [Butyrivibrio sp.]